VRRVASGPLHSALDWLGCATFRLALDDVVVMLDAYVDRVPGAPGPGLGADDIPAADWILVGHSHFDHLWGAERIARNTGATVVGSYETVRVLLAAGVPARQLIPVAGGERIELAPHVVVSVHPSQHSCVWAHRQFPGADAVCLGDLGVTYQERQGRFAELGAWLVGLGPEVLGHLRASDQHALGDGGALVFVLDTPAGRLLYQDTSGCWTPILRDLHPDVAILAAAGRGNLDGEPIQGSLAQFVAAEARLLGPRRVVLAHHDDWLPGFTDGDLDVTPIRDHLARTVPSTELVELDYLSASDVLTSR
jgi:L-ascorbate metabolism protein UlaG (beta-lactamase superfamily)